MLTRPELLRRLQSLNPLLFMPDDSVFPYLIQGAEVVGLYWGNPANATKKLICSLPAGFVPEFTQIAPDGRIIARGWRAVLLKCIKAGAVDVVKAEKVFAVSMSREGKDEICTQCQRTGQSNKSDGGASGLCKTHEYVRLATQRQESLINEYRNS